jgi:CO/xanthine dehydrogenase FAD-binding subunit
VPHYALITPSDLADALRLLGEGWRPFAGGTDLMVLFEAGQLDHRKWFSIWNLPSLHGITETPEHITLGALTTYCNVLANATLAREFPMLCRAARETGGMATQNRGTLGGNIVNASPAADSPPALLCYDAELELVSAQGSRWVAYHEFHLAYKKMLLRPDELLKSIRLPRRKGPWRDFYRKVGARKAQAISKVCFAGSVLAEGGVIRDIRIALGSVAPIPLRCRITESILRGIHPSPAWFAAARRELAGEITPIDDVRSTAAYRSRVAQNLLREFLSQV